MRTVRRIMLWVVLAAIVVLAVLSVVGAFLKADRAKDLFNSPPLVAYWFVLAAVLAAGFVFFRRLITSPAALGMHLGSLLVLAGAMWGSEAGHDVRRALVGSQKVPGGYMVLYEGHRENRILGPKSRASDAPVAELPFYVHLKDFWIEYYPSKQKTWDLFVVGPVRDGAGHVVERRQVNVPWTVGQPTDLPLTRARLTVLQYLEHAEPTFDDEAEPVIEIALPGDTKAVLPARVGAEIDLDEPKMTVRVVKVFENMRLRGTGDDRRIVDLPGEGTNPAVLVHLVEADGTTHQRYLMALVPMHGYRDPGPPMAYVFPEPTGARADPSSAVPAMEVLVECDGRSLRHWFLPAEADPYVSVDLAPLVSGKTEPAGDDAQTALFLAKPTGPIRDYFSELSVIEDGKQVAAKVIQVNDPLHWGGYHFYQADYDKQAGRYTVLSVTSDSGWWWGSLPGLVPVGFALLVAATFWRFWGEAVVRYVGQRHAAGGGSANSPRA